MIYYVIATLLAALLFVLRHVAALQDRRATASDPQASNLEAAQKARAETALQRAIDGDLQGLRNAITQYGLAAGSASAILKQARERRNALAEDARVASREQKVNRHREKKRILHQQAEAAATEAAVVRSYATRSQDVGDFQPAVERADAEPATHSRARGRFVDVLRLVHVGRAFRAARGARASHAKAKADITRQDSAAAIAPAVAGVAVENMGTTAAATGAAAAPSESVAATTTTASVVEAAPPPMRWAAMARGAAGDEHAMSPAMARFEAAVKAALGAGTTGLPAFRRAIDGMPLPAPTFGPLRASVLRLVGERLRGDRPAEEATLVEAVALPMLTALHGTYLEPKLSVREALFFPSTSAKERLVRHLASARVSCDVCLYTITDGELVDALLRLHANGVSVRVISDDEMATSAGSDVFALAKAGVPVVLAEELLRPRAAHRKSLYRVERHMHHKFAIVDSRLLLTGSYNWTKAAATVNLENILVTSSAYSVSAFAAQFNHLWTSFTEKLPLSSHAAAVRIQSIQRGLQSRGHIASTAARQPPLALANKSRSVIRRASMSAATVAAVLARELEWGDEVDSLLEAAEGGCGEKATDDAARAALDHLNAEPVHAAMLREVTMRTLAERIGQGGGGDQAAKLQHSTSALLLRACGLVLGAIETKLLQPPSKREALFFPSERNHARLLATIGRARRTIDVAIYDLTDGHLCEALLARHRAGVVVRLMADGENSSRDSSCVQQLASAGVATVVNRNPAAAERKKPILLHHKFMVIDEATLVTGSYNFTYAAFSKNFENLLLVDDSFFVLQYSDEFERLWVLASDGEARTDSRGARAARKSLAGAALKLQALQRGRLARSTTARRRSMLMDAQHFPPLGS